VGGNAEAARRAGINVAFMRIAAFVICSAMAAVGYIIAASRGNSVDPDTGGSNVLLLTVGSAVIDGTSLFGGRGRVIDAVLAEWWWPSSRTAWVSWDTAAVSSTLSRVRPC
jgi:D-xylose transport system permease protein